MPLRNKQKCPTIGYASKVTGCNIETIRYYERVGLLPKPPRTPGGFRLYNDAHIKRLNFIRRARKLGFHLNEIRDLLSLVDANTYTCAQVKCITLNHLDEIEQKLADLTKLKAVLTDMASQCEGQKAPDCPMIDVLFKS